MGIPFPLAEAQVIDRDVDERVAKKLRHPGAASFVIWQHRAHTWIDAPSPATHPGIWPSTKRQGANCTAATQQTACRNLR
jgi:hypothetical protein